jgi:hypothetical protein
MLPESSYEQYALKQRPPSSECYTSLSSAATMYGDTDEPKDIDSPTAKPEDPSLELARNNTLTKCLLSEFQASLSSATTMYDDTDQSKEINSIAARLEKVNLKLDQDHNFTEFDSTRPLKENTTTNLYEHEQPEFSVSVPLDDSAECIDTPTMEQYIESILANQGQHLTASTMDYYHSVAMSQPTFIQCPGGRNDAGANQPTKGVGGSNRAPRREGHTTQGSKGKLPQQSREGTNDHHDDEDDDQDRRPNKRRRGSGRISDDSHKFVCPYYKRNPPEHMKHGACSGPGFPTVHRLKYVERVRRLFRLLTMQSLESICTAVIVSLSVQYVGSFSIFSKIL